MLRHLTYACINLSLPNITTGRTLRQSTFTLDKAANLCLLNSQDLISILQWNVDHHIHYFRIGSGLFPFADHPVHHYTLDRLPLGNTIKETLQRAGNLAKSHNLRLSCHPGPYTCIASPNPLVVTNSILALEYHSYIADLLGYGPEFKINIHVGGSYGNLDQTATRFCQAFDQLSCKCKSRLTLENDDTPSMWSVRGIYDKIYKCIGVPITFDYHHWSLYPDGQNLEDAANMAFETWKDEVPETHYSESRDHKNREAHSDYVCNKIPVFSVDKMYDCTIEAKMKDLALFRYKEKFG